MRVVNFSEARNNLKDDAVVMSLETFNSYMETFHLLRSPANAAHLAKSIEQYKSGKKHEI